MALNNFNPIPNDPNDPNGGGGGGPMQPIINPWDGVDPFTAEDYLINYNEKYKNESPILFRDSVINQTLSCLIGKYKSNAVLIGPAGVGKTKIAEDIARRIASKDPSIPDRLADYTIWELPLSNIIAGSGIIGDVEKKAKTIIEFASDPNKKVILFIDEIHMLFDGDKTYGKVAQMLKPAMARNEIKVIGSTTVQEAQNLTEDPAFNRRFTRIIVDELTKEQTKVILDQIKIPLFDHYERKITITDRVIEDIVRVADEYKTIGSHRPDNAITLLDRSMADALIHRKRLEMQAKTDPNLQAALANTSTISLSKSQMRKTAMRLITGNNEKAGLEMDSLKDSLSVIKGQDEVIKSVLDCIERDNLGIFPRSKPLTMLFAGNSGVGKSEIAKILANQLNNEKAIILNMPEYHSSASINRIIGSPAGYVGSDSKTELPFDILESNPYQVIILDEFEKANTSVQKLFMSAFDEGYIKTSKNKTVDFSKSIIIATTNAGYANVESSIGYTSGKESHASISDLAKYLPLEILNRFTKIFNFCSIDETLFREIVNDTYSRKIAEIKKAHSSYAFMPDDMPDDDLNTLVKENFKKEFGARPAPKAVQKYIEDKILEYSHSKAANAPEAND